VLSVDVSRVDLHREVTCS